MKRIVIDHVWEPVAYWSEGIQEVLAVKVREQLHWNTALSFFANLLFPTYLAPRGGRHGLPDGRPVLLGSVESEGRGSLLVALWPDATLFGSYADGLGAESRFPRCKAPPH